MALLQFFPRYPSFLLSLLFVLSAISSSNHALTTASPQKQPPSAELDAFWAQAASVVSKGDFETYAAMYHPDAVLVQTTTPPGSTKPIAKALENWKPGFEETAAGHQIVDLEFRFSHRLESPTSAHEWGIFRYQSTQKASPEETTTVFMHFESLLVKKSPGGWLWMMEYQKQKATEVEWEQLAPKTTTGDSSSEA